MSSVFGIFKCLMRLGIQIKNILLYKVVHVWCTSYLFTFRTVKVPTTDLVISCEHVHGHHADGKRNCANDHLPGVGGHQEAMHTEETSQHGAAGLTKDTCRER